VIFPGRICSSGGCDFQDALLEIDGEKVNGNIEVHVLASQWRSHKHNLDKRYNDVILHVAMWRETSSVAMLQDERNIPTISLSDCLSISKGILSKNLQSSYRFISLCPHFRTSMDTTSLVNIFAISGRKRFYEKVKHFKKALLTVDAAQVLYRNIARGLGYSKNMKPFEAVADKITLNTLESIEEGDDALRQALIVGTAGLLPSQRFKKSHDVTEDAYVTILEKIWLSQKINGAINPNEWCFFRVRPGNSPIRRLIALSYLIGQYKNPGLLQGILNLVREAPNKKEYHWINKGLTFRADGYWSNHIDFSLPTKVSGELVGRERASEIVVNVLLPFAYAYGSLHSEPKLQEKAININSHYPAGGDNQIIRYMRQQFLLRPDLKMSSLVQQGILYIYKKHCCYRNCKKCSIAINQN
jgi:hypothetical protein